MSSFVYDIASGQQCVINYESASYEMIYLILFTKRVFFLLLSSSRCHWCFSLWFCLWTWCIYRVINSLAVKGKSRLHFIFNRFNTYSDDCYYAFITRIVTVPLISLWVNSFSEMYSGNIESVLIWKFQLKNIKSDSIK